MALKNGQFAKPASSEDFPGYKWLDADNDGMWDSGEPGLEGWTIYLDADDDGVLDPGELSTTTDVDGFYEFAPLVPADYVVREELLDQNAFLQTYPPGPDFKHVVTVVAGKRLPAVSK